MAADRNGGRELRFPGACGEERPAGSGGSARRPRSGCQAAVAAEPPKGVELNLAVVWAAARGEATTRGHGGGDGGKQPPAGGGPGGSDAGNRRTASGVAGGGAGQAASP